MEYLFGGALAAIILVSLVLTIYSFTTEDIPPQPVQQLRFQCQDCAHEFEVASNEFRLTEGPLAGSVSMVGARIGDCPECGGAAFEMTKCVKCGHYWIPDRVRNWRAYLGNRNAAPPDICPKCKTNQTQYKLKMLRERK